MDAAWQRPCCIPTGCLSDGLVNLYEPDGVAKVICNSENCSVGPYMHKECFVRWEDGLLTYLRSHGRARGWSEKQRRQNLWTKKGYDLAFRACGCLCGRGHLRKDLHWDPQDVAFHLESGEVVKAEEGCKKKNRKKHKDLPTLGNKFTPGSMKSKSKPIPGIKGNRNPAGSNSAITSIDQGYSSASPANTDLGIAGGFIFSPPLGSRYYYPTSSGNHNCSMKSSSNMFSANSILPEIPDNDIVQNFYDRPAFRASSQGTSRSCLSPHEQDMARQMQEWTSRQRFNHQQDSFECANNMESIYPPSPHLNKHDQKMMQLNRMMDNVHMSNRPASDFCLDNRQASLSLFSERNRSLSESTADSFDTTTNDASPLFPYMFDFDSHQDLAVEKQHIQMYDQYRSATSGVEQNELHMSCSYTQGGFGENMTLTDQQSKPLVEKPDSNPTYSNTFKNEVSQTVPKSNMLNEVQAQLLPENLISMMYNNMDPQNPQMIVVPSGRNEITSRRAYTEICIIPMCTTTFTKRQNFTQFQDLLPPSEVNPYHIKMEGEGYGSDDLRNFILSKLSQARCSQMNCVVCSTELPIYDQFPLLDGTMYLSSERNRNENKQELKLDIENKREYVHAVCMRCLEGVHNIVCRMCKARWQGSYHQLGYLYMYDIFAANPCCQDRLNCKQCGVPIVDHHVGLKYFSEYSNKITCPICRNCDYHFVHPASTYQLIGLVFS